VASRRSVSAVRSHRGRDESPEKNATGRTAITSCRRRHRATPLSVVLLSARSWAWRCVSLRRSG
jgi:hypothetical protein